MLIQFHILQNYSPANLNRDDTGAPKDAIFGGVRRGRISSQCLKRSIRRSETFSNAFDKDDLLGVRTRRLPFLVKTELQAMGIEEPELSEIVSKLAGVGRESAKKKAEESTENDEDEEITASEDMVKQLIFIGKNEVRPMAEKLHAIYQRLGQKEWQKNEIAKITKELGLSTPKSMDIAMFGRMTTSEAFEDVNAAVQVAHALSTNALNQEFDYFTAVDDLSLEAGAGMIGDIEFNSSTYYKYINVHWDELVANLGGDVEAASRGVLALLEACITAQPSGKQNTFAAFNLPELVLVEVSQNNLPVSYANAFLKPVRVTHDGNLMENSIQRLSEYMEKIARAYNLEARRACLTVDGNEFQASETLPSLNDLKQWLRMQLPVEA